MHEIFLTTQVTDSTWRLKRAHRMESDILSTSIDPFGDQRLVRLTRYIASLERSFYKAYTELKKISAERNAAELIPAMQYDIHGNYTHQPINAWEIMREKNAAKPEIQNGAKIESIHKL
jgi:hypothetical protein